MKIIFLLLASACVHIGCDGKPPKFVEEKLNRTAASKPKAIETGNALYNAAFTTDSLWRRGYEETQTYSVTQSADGKVYRGTEIWTTRLEAFSRTTYAAADSEQNSLPVLVQHRIGHLAIETQTQSDTGEKKTRIQTAEMIAVDLRNAAALVKYALSLQSKTNIVSKTLRRLVGRSMLYYHTLREGDGETELEQDVFLEDQIPLSMRALNFAPDKVFYRHVTASPRFATALSPEVYEETEFKILAMDTVETNGTRTAAWHLQVSLNNATVSSYWFDTNFPHPLVKAALHGGTEIEARATGK